MLSLALETHEAYFCMNDLTLRRPPVTSNIIEPKMTFRVKCDVNEVSQSTSNCKI